MSEVISRQPAKVMIYGCGGAAANILSELEPLRGKPDPGFADMSLCYIDTSRSNLGDKEILDEYLYLFEGVDGSGKVRSSNYDDISKQSLAILQKFKPTNFNIVVHSASGGSGSVIGPILVSEMKAKGEQVIVIIVGSTDTRIEIENTIKTLKSYEAIAGLRNSPVIVHYQENSKDYTRHQVNKQVKYAISLLCGLFSGQNKELDTADLRNWMEFLRFTNEQAQLSSLNFVTDQRDIAKIGTVSSVATLALLDMATRLDATPGYQCVGYAPDSWRTGSGNQQLIANEPIHYAISTDFITRQTKELTDTLKEVDSQFASRVARPSLLGKNDHASDKGVVL